MAETKVAYAASATIACDLDVDPLANGGYRESASVDNTTNLYMDALLNGSIQVGTVTVAGFINIWAYGAVDDGNTQYSGGLAGTDETITWGTTPSTSSVLGYRQLFLVGVIAVDPTDDDNDIEFGPFSIAQAFGGVLPRSWGIVVENQTGVALHTTGTNNVLSYSGVTYNTA